MFECSRCTQYNQNLSSRYNNWIPSQLIRMSFTFDQVEEKRYEQLQIRILEALTQQMNPNQKGITDDPFKSHVDHIFNFIHEFHFFGWLALHLNRGSRNTKMCSKST
ncbi:unnamed protein product [Schistosoma haematobium]|nr:unnamed protein product [Schistosoma haematobium]